jgi:hypothetical protein
MAPPVPTQALNKAKAIKARHVYVRDDQVKFIILKHLKGRLTVLGLRHLEAAINKGDAEQGTHASTIIDRQNFRSRHWHFPCPTLDRADGGLIAQPALQILVLEKNPSKPADHQISALITQS